jgi:hypothetical protein
MEEDLRTYYGPFPRADPHSNRVSEEIQRKGALACATLSVSNDNE